MLTSKIINEIKNIVQHQAPDATLILYGSYARGDNRPDSDIDLLILLNKENITKNDENLITDKLFELEFATGQIISPMVVSKKEWENRMMITPFYENVNREGIIL